MCVCLFVWGCFVVVVCFFFGGGGGGGYLKYPVYFISRLFKDYLAGNFD